jgi:hypothetical protein
LLPASERVETVVALAAGATLALVAVVVFDLEQAFPPALDLQQAFVAVVVSLTEVAFAPSVAAADLEQAFPPVLDLQQALVVVAVLTVAALAVLDFAQAVFDLEQVFVAVVFAAAALALSEVIP